MIAIRPRRSALYIPGSNTRALDKAASLDADVLILDLEDAVSPQGKQEARENIAARMAGGFGQKEVVIRVNGAETPWGEDDLTFCAEIRPAAVLVPKVGSASAVMALARVLEKLKTPETTRIWAMIETPLAILNLATIASVAQDPASRLDCLVMGTNDLIKDSRALPVPGRANLMPWLMLALAAARAYGLSILDGVYNRLDDGEGFLAECRQGAECGFDGKTLIHPGQIAPANGVFSPSAEEIARARTIIALFERPENIGKGVVSLDGEMIERLHADIARRIVAIADVIAKQGSFAEH